MGKSVLISAALGVLGFAGAALADGPAQGCFERIYSDNHLAGQPDQVVKRIVLEIYQQEGGANVAEMLVRTSQQGHVAASGRGGQVFRQFLLCWSDGARDMCSVECDGGLMEITSQNDKGLSFRTQTLWVGQTDGCGGAINIIETPEKAVSYRLNRVSRDVCDGLF